MSTAHDLQHRYHMMVIADDQFASGKMNPVSDHSSAHKESANIACVFVPVTNSSSGNCPSVI